MTNSDRVELGPGYGQAAAGGELENPPRFVVRGFVERGDQRGRTLGFPTANVAVEQTPALDGVWAGFLDLRSDSHVAAISVGSRPTFYGPGGFRLLEAHILDFSDNCYQEVATVWLCHRLRPQVRFASIGELTAQLARDVAQTRAWARSAGAWQLVAQPALLDAPLGRALPVDLAA